VSAQCGTDSSSAIAVFVTPLPVAGVIIAAPDSICAGSISLLTVSGDSGITQWQNSVNGLSFSDISSANGTTYGTPALTQTMYYRVRVNNQCGIDSSSAVTVFVKPLPITGSITAVPDTLCAGNFSVISLDGSSGVILWQSSTGGGNYATVGGDSANYTTPMLSQSINYRVVLNNGMCTDTSAPISIIVNANPPQPVLSATDSVICSSDSTEITSSGSYSSYLWNNGDTRSYTYANSAGDYWLSVTDANGCSAVSQHTGINVYSVPFVSIAGNGDTLFSHNAISYQWYQDSVAIPGATDSLYIVTETGYYSVQIMDTNGCKATSTNLLVVINGINQTTKSGEIDIYPNPFGSSIFVKAGHGAAFVSRMEICDELGREVFSESMNNAAQQIIELPVEKLIPGVYFIKVELNNEDVYIEKMVKQ
jgi:hypothetical protein